MDVPFHDFAGSGVVHLTGGCGAFVGALLVGPRAGRWQEQSTLEDDSRYRPHSVDNIVSGTFLLWFGWLGFNPGSTVSLIGDNSDIGSLAYVNTIITPVFSALTTMLIGWFRHSYWYPYWYGEDEENRPPLFELGKVKYPDFVLDDVLEYPLVASASRKT